MTLKQLKESKNLSYAELAQFLGFSGANPTREAQRYCLGRIPRPETIKKIAQVTKGKVSPSDWYK
tara:strand:+ start:2169 stop:2363 length:195 start_codon:yes stop_codon:yes gene_type:complete